MSIMRGLQYYVNQTIQSETAVQFMAGSGQWRNYSGAAVDIA